VAHFLEHLHFKGTKVRSRSSLELSVESIGGSLNAYTSRENTSYMMTVFRQDITKAVEIVGDMLTNSLYRRQDVENERSTIHRELIETRKSQPLETTIEIAHRGIFKDQQIGLPILGDIANMETITKEMIEQYHNQNYVGENIIVVAEGNINHDELVTAV
jgi:predicted Zn-dependent peptidase